MGKDFDSSKYECSIHGGDGDADCPECWGRLGDLIRGLDDKFAEEGKGSINLVADDETMEKLNR
jgi:hypothetical protein